MTNMVNLLPWSQAYDRRRVAQAHDLARVIAEFSEVTLIAGGFLRDLRMGWDPKDLDIFTYDCDIGKLQELPENFEHLGKPYPATHQPIRTVQEGYSHALEMPVHVIDLASPFNYDSLISHFDIGICQIYHHHQQKNPRCTLAFIDDLQAKNVTITLPPNSAMSRILNTQRRAERFRMRWPDYTIRDPNGILNMHKETYRVRHDDVPEYTDDIPF